MKHFILAALVGVLVSGPASSTTFICDTKGAYDIKNGEVVPSKTKYSDLIAWPKVVFDDVSGLFKYGKKDRWTEEKMVVTQKGSKSGSASGHYMHNGAIFSAINVYSWKIPIEFQWLGGGNSALMTGTCTHYGNLE